MIFNLFLLANTLTLNPGDGLEASTIANPYTVNINTVLEQTSEPNQSYTPIPLQVPVSDDRYTQFFDYASGHVGEETSDCARFVNRILRARFGIIVYGNAWDMQSKKENQVYLPFEWSIRNDEIYRENDFNFPWGSFSKRIDHFRELYTVLENQEHPIGVIGFIYKYSAYKQVLHDYPFILPQTHVVFLAGEKEFDILNDTDQPQTIEDILTAQHGIIKSYERDFVHEKVPLDLVLQPGESYTYSDYLIEEHFRRTMSGSLLDLFLRKHRNNRVEEILRPISFSRISDDLGFRLQTQQSLLDSEGVQLVSSQEFLDSSWSTDDSWLEYLNTKFGIHNPKREFFLPIPHSADLFSSAP